MKLPSNKTWYAIYKKLPEITAIVLAVLYFVWAIVDPIVFGDHEEWYKPNGTYHEPEYGIFAFPSWFLAFLVWLLIGAISVALIYVIMKVRFSKTLLEMEYLESIEKSAKTLTNANNQTVAPVQSSSSSAIPPTHNLDKIDNLN
jgi:hypothetical protein